MKKGYIITTIIILAFIATITFFSIFFTSDTISVKTEFGDQFSVLCDDFGDLYVINDVNSDFSTDLYYFSDKKQFHSICDNQYIRCYNISDGDSDLGNDKFSGKFIFKIKKYDKFFSVRYGDVKYSSEYMFKDDAEKVKSEFLCDDLLMKICIIDLDYLYHDEMLEIGNKLINHEFDELEKYGLTKDMISDTESLNEKIAIMENYLKEYQ
ncbi:MAG: hypothetical protein J6B75_07735 [Ruminococcus sp.]|nr:hypothetical protein [Ruminococcus sp.]